MAAAAAKAKPSAAKAKAKVAAAKPKAAPRVSELDGGSGSRRRQLSRRDSDERVERALAQHFSHMSDYQMNVKLVNNRTMRQKDSEAIASTRLTKKRLGANFWKLVSDPYFDNLDTIESLKADDPNASVNEMLLKLIGEVHHEDPSKRTMQGLMGWLPVAPEFKQNEFIGLIKACLSTKMAMRPTTDPLVVEIMRYII